MKTSQIRQHFPRITNQNINSIIISQNYNRILDLASMYGKGYKSHLSENILPISLIPTKQNFSQSKKHNHNHSDSNEIRDKNMLMLQVQKKLIVKERISNNPFMTNEKNQQRAVTRDSLRTQTKQSIKIGLSKKLIQNNKVQVQYQRGKTQSSIKQTNIRQFFGQQEICNERKSINIKINKVKVILNQTKQRNQEEFIPYAKQNNYQIKPYNKKRLTDKAENKQDKKSMKIVSLKQIKMEQNEDSGLFFTTKQGNQDSDLDDFYNQILKIKTNKA